MAHSFCPECGHKNNHINCKTPKFCASCGEDLSGLGSFSSKGSSSGNAPAQSEKQKEINDNLKALIIEHELFDIDLSGETLDESLEGGLEGVEASEDQSTKMTAGDVLSSAPGIRDSSRQGMSSSIKRSRDQKEQIHAEYKREAGFRSKGERKEVNG